MRLGNKYYEWFDLDQYFGIRHMIKEVFQPNK